MLAIGYPPYDCEYCFELLIAFQCLTRPSVLSSDPRLLLVAGGIETPKAVWDELLLISSTASIYYLQSLNNVFICCRQEKLTYFIYFPWILVETAQLNFNVRFVASKGLWQRMNKNKGYWQQCLIISVINLSVLKRSVR